MKKVVGRKNSFGKLVGGSIKRGIKKTGNVNNVSRRNFKSFRRNCIIGRIAASG